MSSVDKSASGKVRRRFRLAVAVVGLVYGTALLSFWSFVPGTLGHVDAASKIWQVESLLQGQRHLIYPAEPLDPDYRYIPDWYVVRVGGRPYSIHLNLMAWMNYVAVLVVGRLAYNLVPLVSSIVTVALSACLVRRHGLAAGRNLWRVTLAVGLCTPMLYYSVLTLEHIVAAAFAAGAFVLAAEALKQLRAGTPKLDWRLLAGSGACLGLATLARGECGLLAVAMGLIVVLLARRAGMVRTLSAGAAMALGGFLMLGLYFLLFPDGLKIQMAFSVQGTKERIALLVRLWKLTLFAGLGDRLTSMVGETLSDWISAVGGASLGVAMCVGLFAGTRRALMRCAATAAFLLGLGVILVALEPQGLVLVCPFIVPAAFIVRGNADWKNPAAQLVIGTSAVFLLLLWLLLTTPGAVQFGPRFLVPVIAPLAAVVLGLLFMRLEKAPARWFRLMLILALLSAFATEVKGIIQCRRGATYARTTQSELEKLPAPIVVFSPYLAKEFYLYQSPRVLMTTPVLQAMDGKQFVEIIELLKGKGITHFSMVCNDGLAADHLRTLERAGGTVAGARKLPHNGTAYVVKLSRTVHQE